VQSDQYPSGVQFLDSRQAFELHCMALGIDCDRIALCQILGGIAQEFSDLRRFKVFFSSNHDSEILDAQLFTFRYSKGDCHLSVFQVGSSVRQKKSLHCENLEYLLLRKGGRFEVRKMRSFLVQSKPRSLHFLHAPTERNCLD
jgi:hypothetical protein